MIIVINAINHNTGHLKTHYNKIAAQYHRYTHWNRLIASRLLSRLDLVTLQPQSILDLGAGSGVHQQALCKRYPQATYYAVDHSEGMLQQLKTSRWFWQNKKHKMLANAHDIPLPDHSIDLIFSNLMFPDCNIEAIQNTLIEVKRLLSKGGLFLFSTLGPDSLQEVQALFAQIDGYQHVNSHLDMHHLGDLLQKFEFSDPVVDMECLQLGYRDWKTGHCDLKHNGVLFDQPTGKRRKGLMTPRQREKIKQAMNERLNEQGEFVTQLEVVYGLAWQSAATDLTASTKETTVAVSSIKKAE